MSDNMMMSLLACPLSPDLAGTVWLYRLPDKIESEWQRLRGQYRALTHTDGNLPYTGLLTVLRASGNTSASLWPSSKAHPPRILAMSKRLSAPHLRFAVCLWEQAMLGVKAHAMTLDHTSTLADLFASTEPDQVRVWDHIQVGPRAVDADGWVFDAVNFNVTAQLAAQKLIVDGLKIPLRADSENNLVVWDNDFLWSNTWHATSSPRSDKAPASSTSDLPEWKTRLYRAAMRIDVAMKSVHALPVPLLTLRPHVSRLSNTVSSARTGWFAPRSPNAPLLNVALGGTGKNTHLEHTSRLALDAWVRLKDEPVFPRAKDTKEFLPISALGISGSPGNFRVLVPFSTSYPVGRSVGIHTVAALADHLAEATGQDLLRARQVVKNLGIGTRQTDNGRDTVLLDDEALEEIMRAAGCSRLRILALYQHQDTRTRMQRLLAYHFNRPDLADGMPEDKVVALGCRTEVLFHHAPDLLAHGDHAQRPALVAALPGLQANDTGVLALVETEFDAKRWSKQRRDAEYGVEGAVDPYPLDAKPKVSRLLAQHGVLAQFITKPKKKRPSPATEAEQPASPLDALGQELKNDHPGHNAIGDMLRAAGLVHPRLTRTITHRGGLQHPLAHVGLHLREQRGAYYKKRTDRPALMWILTAFVPIAGHWKTLAYVPPGPYGAGGWFDYALAQVISRRHPIPEGSRSESVLPRRIDHALFQLREWIGTTEYVLYVSGDSTRSVWPLMSNKNADLPADEIGQVNGRPALPGATLDPAHRPKAIIRTTSSTNPSIPVPAVFHTVDDLGNEAAGPRTSNALFQIDDASTTYFMSRLPLQATGGTPSAKLGRKNSRWTAANGAEQAENWHCLTSTEIAVITHPAGEESLPYAVTTARLCTHALAWMGRTQHPLPIHAAIQMDKNHPDYRRTIDSDSENDG
ncbi:RNaseH domain-containing protein [Streptomyces sp. NPDC056053]|uniref:RNaseH domain-containing protein n=1 Tax=Streptomyces sp. NPDC056053 TaxID=3345696 RepID=UPI0035D53E95